MASGGSVGTCCCAKEGVLPREVQEDAATHHGGPALDGGVRLDGCGSL